MPSIEEAGEGPQCATSGEVRRSAQGPNDSQNLHEQVGSACGTVGLTGVSAAPGGPLVRHGAGCPPSCSLCPPARPCSGLMAAALRPARWAASTQLRTVGGSAGRRPATCGRCCSLTSMGCSCTTTLTRRQARTTTSCGQACSTYCGWHGATGAGAGAGSGVGRHWCSRHGSWRHCCRQLIALRCWVLPPPLYPIRLGIFSSATRKTVLAALQKLHANLANALEQWPHKQVQREWATRGPRRRRRAGRQQGVGGVYAAAAVAGRRAPVPGCSSHPPALLAPCSATSCPLPKCLTACSRW